MYCSGRRWPPVRPPIAGLAAGLLARRGLLAQVRDLSLELLELQGAADTVVDPRNAKLLAGRIPGAQLVIFPELGHLLLWQEPDSIADVVTLFLLDGAKINKSAPPAGPGTTGRGRPVGAAPSP
jgi:pimeloyl-ACP methyl ester carboxylesterase